MKFQSSWITTQDFIGLPSLDMYHKQFEKKLIPQSRLENYHVHFRKKLFIEACENIHINISADDHVFTDSPVPTVDVYSVKPKEIIKIEKGKYFIDFGTELSGQFYMKIKGRKGQKMRILCGEELLENTLCALRDAM